MNNEDSTYIRMKYGKVRLSEKWMNNIPIDARKRLLTRFNHGIISNYTHTWSKEILRHIFSYSNKYTILESIKIIEEELSLYEEDKTKNYD